MEINDGNIMVCNGVLKCLFMLVRKWGMWFFLVVEYIIFLLVKMDLLVVL